MDSAGITNESGVTGRYHVCELMKLRFVLGHLLNRMSSSEGLAIFYT